ncbi:MAG: hypothetical protein VB077_04735 [Desulfitobacterium sp.]|nr:hypothetical protein [Desulfitobacterium sp.]
MSLNEVKLSSVRFKDIVLKQYLYKLKGHSGWIHSLILIQLISLLFSMSPMGGMSSGGDSFHININTYTGDAFLVLTMIWMAVMTSFLGSQAYRSIDFSLVSNRITSYVSNAALILTFAVYAGITGTLMSLLQRMVLVKSLGESEFIFGGVQMAPWDILLSIFVATLYLLLLASVTYLIQMVSALNKAAGIALGVFILAFGFGWIRIFEFKVENVLLFYTAESSLGLFALKVIGSVVLLLGLSMLISGRMEVKR